MLERFRDLDALLQHGANIGDELMAEIVATGDCHGELLGDVPAEIRAILADSPVQVFLPSRARSREAAHGRHRWRPRVDLPALPTQWPRPEGRGPPHPTRRSSMASGGATAAVPRSCERSSAVLGDQRLAGVQLRGTRRSPPGRTRCRSRRHRVRCRGTGRRSLRPDERWADPFQLRPGPGPRGEMPTSWSESARQDGSRPYIFREERVDHLDVPHVHASLEQSIPDRKVNRSPLHRPGRDHRAVPGADPGQPADPAQRDQHHRPERLHPDPGDRHGDDHHRRAHRPLGRIGGRLRRRDERDHDRQLAWPGRLGILASVLVGA